jgi:2,3-diketo-5-methylthio-1-phosphopentane phosphatase
MNKQFKIFMDFDGTISKIDVGDELFRKFGKEELTNKIIDDLLNDRISSRECWTRLCEGVDSINKNDLDEFILGVEVEPSFHQFVKYSNEHNFDLFILSDGFDYYINKILNREGLKQLKVYSNSLSITEEGVLVPSFPFLNENCKSTANCKRNHIIEHSGESDHTVFIGDGNSDKDPIEYVDFIFAKDDLLKYCEKQRITYFPFNDFIDIINRLDELSSKKRLKKRHQAELKRREAYLAE